MSLVANERSPTIPEGDYLRLENISRRFGGIQALDTVSLGIGKGQILCLVGQSGCGKSSLLRVISGVDRPDSGRIWLDGIEIASPSVHVEPEARNIGFMFQDYALFPHLDVTGNILFGLRHLPREEARRRCAEIIERLGLGALAGRFMHMLSGGEQQRVALARALAPQPRLLLMDEPFSNLDRRLHAEIRDSTIALLRDFNTTAVLVTHDPAEALSAGDRIALMHRGRIVQSGTGSELYDQPRSAYAAEFFCTFNKLEGHCRGGYLETALGSFAAGDLADGARATAYIRPQSLRISGDGRIAGQVVHRSLMGEIEQLTVAIERLATPLILRSTERSGLRPGHPVRLDVRPESVLVF